MKREIRRDYNMLHETIKEKSRNAALICISKNVMHYRFKNL